MTKYLAQQYNSDGYTPVPIEQIDIGLSLLKGARQALAYAKGKKLKARVHKVMIPMEVDVKTMRHDLDMNRKEFCENFGFSIRTLEE